MENQNEIQQIIVFVPNGERELTIGEYDIVKIKKEEERTTGKVRFRGFDKDENLIIELYPESCSYEINYVNN